MPTGIIDYGVGNLRSVFSAVEAVGGQPVVTSCPSELMACDRLILPGVGAFAHGMAELKSRCLDTLIREAALESKPIMGICLGMQMLAHSSLEFGKTDGIGLADGVVSLIGSTKPGQLLRLPHVGWKPLALTNDELGWLFEGVDPAARFYFIHSFALSSSSAHIAATAEYDGITFGAVLSTGSVVGTQFHPEKSGPEGLKMLKNFIGKKA